MLFGILQPVPVDEEHEAFDTLQATVNKVTLQYELYTILYIYCSQSKILSKLTGIVVR